MSRLMIEVDTESKDVLVKLNDEEITNVSRVAISRYADSSGKTKSVDCVIDTWEKVGEDGSKSVTYYTYGSDAAIAAMRGGAKESTKFPGLVENIRDGNVIATIAQFVSQKMLKD